MARKSRVLIVEDEALFVLALKRQLAMDGYHICPPASSGEEALSKIESERPDLVLMDVCLRCKMDGFETAQQIRSKSDVPIIFMSGYQERELIDKSDSVEGSIFLTKPLTPNMLSSAISQLLKKANPLLS